VKEDAVITFELELTTRLLFVYDSQQAAEDLVIAWWKKHNIKYDTWKLIETVQDALNITADYRSTFREMREQEKQAMYFTRTKGQIIEFLKENTGTPAEITVAVNKMLTKPVNSKAVTKSLQRMFEKGEVCRNKYGEYSKMENV